MDTIIGLVAALAAKLSTAAGAVGPNNLASGSVLTEKIADGAVTRDKTHLVSDDASIASASTGPKIESAGSFAGAKAAFVTFLKYGSYSVNFGLSNDHKLKVGGGNMGNYEFEIFHEGNHPVVLSGTSENAPAGWYKANSVYFITE
jgi:hypothetical protein